MFVFVFVLVRIACFNVCVRCLLARMLVVRSFDCVASSVVVFASSFASVRVDCFCGCLLLLVRLFA